MARLLLLVWDIKSGLNGSFEGSEVIVFYAISQRLDRDLRE